jgi:hypothetical protein
MLQGTFLVRNFPLVTYSSLSCFLFLPFSTDASPRVVVTVVVPSFPLLPS